MAVATHVVSLPMSCSACHCYIAHATPLVKVLEVATVALCQYSALAAGHPWHCKCFLAGLAN